MVCPVKDAEYKRTADLLGEDFALSSTSVKDSPKVNKTLDEAIMDNVTLRRNVLWESLNNQPSSAKRNQIHDKIEQLSKIIERLDPEGNKTERIMREEAMKDMDDLVNTSKLALDDWHITNNLRGILFWENEFDRLTRNQNDGSPIQKQFEEMMGKLATAKKNLTQQAEKKIVSRANKVLSNDRVITSQDFNQLSEETLRATLVDLQKSGDAGLQYVAKTLALQVQKRDFQLQNLLDDYEALIKETGIKDTSIFVDLENNLITEINSSFEIKKKLASKYASRGKSLQNYIDFKHKEEITFDAARILAKDQPYIDYIVARLGESDFKKYANRAIEKAHKFEQALKAQKEHLQALGISGVELDQAMHTWKLRNDPNEYMKHISKKDATDKDFDIREFRGRDFLESRPVRFYEDGKKSPWYNEKYYELSADPKKKKFLDKLEEDAMKFRAMLPPNFQDDITSNFLPNVGLDLADTFSRSGIKGVLKDSILQAAISMITEAREESDIIDPISRQPIRKSPISALNRKLEAGDRTKDALKMMQVYGFYAIHNSYMSEVKESITLANYLLQNAQKVNIDKQTITNQNTTWQKALNYHIDAVMYHITQDVEGDIKNIRKKLSLREQRIKERHEKRIAELEDERDLILEEAETQEAITKINLDYAAKINREQAVINSLKSSIYLSGIANLGIQIQQAKALGFNPFSGFANLTYGVFSIFSHAASGLDFNSSQARKAFSVLLHSSKSGATFGKVKDETALKTFHLISKYNVIGKTRDSQYGKRFDGTWESLPYGFLQSGDYFIRGMTMVATLMNTFEEVDGKMVSLWDLYDNKGNLKVQVEGYDGVHEKFLDLRLKIKEISSKLHGNFDADTPQMFKKFALGRIIGQFRASWMIEGVEQRWGKEIYNEYLQRNTKGTFRSLIGTLVDIGKDQGYMTSVKNLALSIVGAKVNYEKYGNVSKFDAANLKSAVFELRITLMLFVLAAMIKMIDTEDEDLKKAMRVAINTITRNHNDISFYFSPQPLDIVTRSLFPVVGILTDTTKAVSSVSKAIFDDDYTAGQAMRQVSKALPYTRFINSLHYQMNNLIDK